MQNNDVNTGKSMIIKDEGSFDAGSVFLFCFSFGVRTLKWALAAHP